MPTKEELEWALNEVGYKYFGDYEFSEDQQKAMEILTRCAAAVLKNTSSPH